MKGYAKDLRSALGANVIALALDAEEPQIFVTVDEAELALECALRLRAESGSGGLAVAEEDHRRDRGDPVALGEAALLVDVHLDELQLAGALLDDAVEHGCDRVARPAPLGPEVDDHVLVALLDFLLEGRFGHNGCHSVIPFAEVERRIPALTH